jgi:hypothetical protein
VLDSNATSGNTQNQIVFDIQTGSSAAQGRATITLSSGQLTITHPVLIDGTTNAGVSGTTPQITIQQLPNDAQTCFDITNTSNVILYGLAIDDFNYGVSINGGGGNELLGDFIGVDATGRTAAGNYAGVTIINSSNNTIGSGNLGQGQTVSQSVISGNGVGIDITSGSTGNVVQTSEIGTNLAGTASLTNGAKSENTVVGVLIEHGASGNTVGGAGKRNLISGILAGDGVHLTGSGTSGNFVGGNFIGTDASGTGIVPNGNGVWVGNGATGNAVGTSGAGNLIRGNTGFATYVTAGNSETDNIT